MSKDIYSSTERARDNEHYEDIDCYCHGDSKAGHWKLQVSWDKTDMKVLAGRPFEYSAHPRGPFEAVEAEDVPPSVRETLLRLANGVERHLRSKYSSMGGEQVLVALATVPGREEALKETVESLLQDKVDKLMVCLNGHESVPAVLNSDPRISYVIKPKGNMGDANKFLWAYDHNGYVLTCDDDLIYPSNYVEYMIDKVEQYQRKAAVSALGHAIIKWPVENYFSNEYRRCWSCLSAVRGDHACNLVGTGVLAFHTDTVRPHIQAFPVPNMADIWFSMLCWQLEVKLIAVDHPDQWIKHTPHVALQDTIAGKAIYENKLHCAVINECTKHFHRGPRRDKQ